MGSIRGCINMAISLSKVKNELLSKIDTDSAVEVEKVERYVELLKLMRNLQKEVNEDGSIVVTINGSQEFYKAHPAIGEINKINSQLLNIEKSFNFKPKVEEEKVSLI